MVDAARLADELRAEQDHAQTQEKLRKALETQIKELQVSDRNQRYFWITKLPSQIYPIITMQYFVCR